MTYATGTTIVLTITPAMTDVTSTSMYIDIDGNGENDTTYTTSTCGSSDCTMTLTVVTTTSADTTFNVTSTQFTFSGTAQNYSVSVFTSSPVDFGAAFFYANGGNQVNVTASVPVTLSFAIRNSADTADTNTCALGILSVASVSTCSYRLRIATNAASGFAVDMGADEAFNSAGYATMTNIGDNVAFAAGAEAYGIQVFTGATTGGRSGLGDYDQPVVEDSAAPYTFNADTSPVPVNINGENFLSFGAPFKTETAPSLTTTSLVTHAAAISISTPGGNYSHTIYYWITGTF